MTYKQIMSAREIRHWITDIGVPAVLITSVVLSDKDVRNALSTKYNKVKTSIKSKFKK